MVQKGNPKEKEVGGSGTSDVRTKVASKKRTPVQDVTATISFETGTTVTEAEAEALDEDSVDDGSTSGHGSVSSNDAPNVVSVEKGEFNEKTGLCMVSFVYTEKNRTKRNNVTVPVEDAVYDDERRKVLHWVMANKKNEPVWREQVERSIKKMQDEKVGYDDWVSWEEYVKAKVDLAQLPKHCLTIFDDSGGKPPAKHQNYDLEVAISPLKKGRKPDCDFHSFKEERDKKWARKGSGFLLDGMICVGIGGSECGKEFVEHKNEATCPEKACVLGEKNPAYWCHVCKLLLCKDCHFSWLSTTTSRRGRKRVN